MASGLCTGRTMENMGPNSVFSAQTRPSCWVMIILLMARPRPPPERSRPPAYDVYSSKIWSMMFGRDGVTGIADVDAVRVRFPERCHDAAPPPVEGRSRCAAFPKVGIPTKFDGSGPGSELTGIVQDIDENLLDLSGFEVKKVLATGEVGGDRDALYRPQRA